MNNSKIGGRTLIICLMFLLLSVNACKEPVSLQSKWLDRKIVIDGDDVDWKGYPFFYDEDTRSSIGLYNDDKNLYLCFQNMDEKIQREILSQGLYIWFNKTGGKEKELALCFPAGGGFGGPGGPGGSPDRSRGMPGPPPDMSSDISGPSGDIPERGSMSDRRPFLRGATPDSKLKIMTSADDRGYVCSMERAARMGIEVKYRIDQSNRFIYELKMPLVENDETAFIAEASAANQIGIGFMTLKVGGKTPSGDRGGIGGGRPGEEVGGGMRGGPGGGMGGGPGGGKGSKAGALEIWTNVTLASKP